MSGGQRGRFAIGVVVSAAAWLMPGCQAPSPAWSVPTTYEIENVSEQARSRIQAALLAGGDRHGFVLLAEEPFRFRLYAVENMAELRRVQETIQRVSGNERVPVILRNAQMEFASVYGSAEADIRLRGSATPGAEVWLDVGDTEYQGVVDAAGTWHADIATNPGLRQRNGWIYAVIRKDEARQYLRINALDRTDQRRIDRSEIPPGSPLLER